MCKDGEGKSSASLSSKAITETPAKAKLRGPNLPPAAPTLHTYNLPTFPHAVWPSSVLLQVQPWQPAPSLPARPWQHTALQCVLGQGVQPQPKNQTARHGTTMLQVGKKQQGGVRKKNREPTSQVSPFRWCHLGSLFLETLFQGTNCTLAKSPYSWERWSSRSILLACGHSLGCHGCSAPWDVKTWEALVSD